jgi:hypothetical protein
LLIKLMAKCCWLFAFMVYAAGCALAIVLPALTLSDDAQREMMMRNMERFPIHAEDIVFVVAALIFELKAARDLYLTSGIGSWVAEFNPGSDGDEKCTTCGKTLDNHHRAGADHYR